MPDAEGFDLRDGFKHGVIAIAVALSIAACAGLAGTLLARWGGAPTAVAVQRGCATFAAAFTLLLGVYTIITLWLH